MSFEIKGCSELRSLISIYRQLLMSDRFFGNKKTISYCNSSKAIALLDINKANSPQWKNVN